MYMTKERLRKLRNEFLLTSISFPFDLYFTEWKQISLKIYFVNAFLQGLFSHHT